MENRKILKPIRSCGREIFRRASSGLKSVVAEKSSLSHSLTIEEFREGGLKIQNVMAYLFIILTAVIARLIPHPPNFAPIGGLALFSGAHFKNKNAFLIPLSAMFFSDLFLGFHRTIFYVYLSFVLIVLIGKKLKSYQFSQLFGATIISSILFYLITNFGVWQTGTMYQKSANGLLQCYLMGLPFLRNTLFGDLFYSFSFFYGFKFLLWFNKKTIKIGFF